MALACHHSYMRLDILFLEDSEVSVLPFYIMWYWILSNRYIMQFLVSMDPNHNPYLCWQGC